jgi:hypothetical protein
MSPLLLAILNTFKQRFRFLCRVAYAFFCPCIDILYSKNIFRQFFSCC